MVDRPKCDKISNTCIEEASLAVIKHIYLQLYQWLICTFVEHIVIEIFTSNAGLLLFCVGFPLKL